MLPTFFCTRFLPLSLRRPGRGLWASLPYCFGSGEYGQCCGFWKQRAHTLVIFLDVSWHRNIDCAVNIIPLQRNAIIQSAGRVLDEGIPGL